MKNVNKGAKSHEQRKNEETSPTKLNKLIIDCLFNSDNNNKIMKRRMMKDNERVEGSNCSFLH